jgi:hypothetical protein
MWERKATGTDLTTVFVRLLDEGTDVWRPVSARRMSASTYQLSEEPAPEEETWSYPPGEIVVAELKTLSEGRVLVAVAKASAFDARSMEALPLAS